MKNTARDERGVGGFPNVRTTERDFRRIKGNTQHNEKGSPKTDHHGALERRQKQNGVKAEKRERAKFLHRVDRRGAEKI